MAGAAIATEAFQPAAAAQCDALGFAAALAWVAHPVQNRTPQELRELAEGVLEEVLALLRP